MSKNTFSEWPPKAYKNLEFLNSPEARKIRVLCELAEPAERFREEKVEDTIVMFGSARIEPEKLARARLRELEKKLKGKRKRSKRDEADLQFARSRVKAAPYYKAAMDLAEELTKWSMSLKDRNRRFLICSGGGPGIMEAANRGASKAGGASIGLGISLPFEQSLNPYVTRDLQFEFHYFFVRKYWFMYLAKALIALPGGFGTLDELFELLTLVQTRKVQKKMAIVLFGAEFWNSVMNMESLVEWGVISPNDLDLFVLKDSVAEARDYIIETLTREYLDA